MALGKTGIFSLEDVNIRQAQEVWPTAWGAAPASNTPIPGGSGKVYFCGGDNDGDLIQRFEVVNLSLIHISEPTTPERIG